MLKDDLAITADLANLLLSAEEMERFGVEVGRMLDFFAKMDELDVSALEPTTHALLAKNRTRVDSPVSFGIEVENLIENAPETEGRFISIPNVL